VLHENFLLPSVATADSLIGMSPSVLPRTAVVGAMDSMSSTSL
jgi:hypothetical protein